MQYSIAINSFDNTQVLIIRKKCFEKYLPHSYNANIAIHLLCISKIITIIHGSIIFILAKNPRLRENWNITWEFIIEFLPNRSDLLFLHLLIRNFLNYAKKLGYYWIMYWIMPLTLRAAHLREIVISKLIERLNR